MPTHFRMSKKGLFIVVCICLAVPAAFYLAQPKAVARVHSFVSTSYLDLGGLSFVDLDLGSEVFLESSPSGSGVGHMMARSLDGQYVAVISDYDASDIRLLRIVRHDGYIVFDQSFSAMDGPMIAAWGEEGLLLLSASGKRSRWDSSHGLTQLGAWASSTNEKEEALADEITGVLPIWIQDALPAILSEAFPLKLTGEERLDLLMAFSFVTGGDGSSLLDLVRKSDGSLVALVGHGPAIQVLDGTPSGRFTKREVFVPPGICQQAQLLEQGDLIGLRVGPSLMRHQPGEVRPQRLILHRLGFVKQYSELRTGYVAFFDPVDSG